MYYIGLPKRFVAGAVFGSDIDEPLEGANIRLVNRSSQEAIETGTDNYGDFEFDGLEIDGDYTLFIEKEGYFEEEMKSVRTEDDVYLGQISLRPKR